MICSAMRPPWTERSGDVEIFFEVEDDGSVAIGCDNVMVGTGRWDGAHLVDFTLHTDSPLGRSGRASAAMIANLEQRIAARLSP
jgi:hypothetical protein